MKTNYNKTNWIDKKTPVNAQNLNKIERAITDLYNNALGKDDIVPGSGIEIETDESGNKIISSEKKTEIEVVTESPETFESNTLYFILDPETKRLTKIMFGDVTIYE